MQTENHGQHDARRVRTIGSTSVFLQRPDPIPDDFVYVDHDGMVGRLVQALRDGGEVDPPLSVCLVGPPGVGKTAAVWAAVKALQTVCYTTQGSTDCSAQELVVFPVPADMTRFDAVASGLCTAALDGGIALFDEIGKVARYCPEALSPLASMLDDRRVLWSDFLKMPFPVARGFAFVCTAQIDEPLPEYITQRMVTFEVTPPSPEAMLHIMEAKAPHAPGGLMAAFRDWASQRVGLSPREGSLVIHYAHRLARQLGPSDPPAHVYRHVVAEAVKVVMGRRPAPAPVRERWP